jgi:hypothetical protein
MRSICNLLPLSSWGFVLCIYGLLLGSGLALTALPVQAQPDGCPPNVDVNRDGMVTPRDALLTFQHFLGNAEPPLDACQQTRANVLNAQTTGITPGDALCILQQFLLLPSCMDSLRGRLVVVSGNNQVGESGGALPEPLVVRLENQFGEPLTGEAVAATIVQGAAEVSTSTTASTRQSSRTFSPSQAGQAVGITDARGEVRFLVVVTAAQSEDDVPDIRVEFAAPNLPDVEPVQALVIVGSIDTADIPLDLAVSGDLVFIADRSGLPVFSVNINNPGEPTQLHPTPLDVAGSEWRLVLEDNRAYVAVNVPARLYILDISNPVRADFPNDADGDRVPDVVIGSVDLPEEVQNHEITGLAVQNGFAYLVTHFRTVEEGEGTLQVVDVRNPTRPEVQSSLLLPRTRPHDIAVAGNAAYVPAGGGGFLIFEISDPAMPVRQGPFGATGDTGFFSNIIVDRGFAYVVETRCTDCNLVSARLREDHFTVLDLRNPLAPQVHAQVQTRRTSRVGDPAPLALAGRFAYLGQLAFGVQVIDIFTPAAPKLVGNITTPSAVLNVAVSGDLIYVTDQIFGLQLIPAPSQSAPDADGDGVIDRFDAFPRDPNEFRDTDRDRMGDNADPDDDNDGFSDAAERQAVPPTEPTDPLSFPPLLPPLGVTHIFVNAACPVPVVDASCAVSPQEGNGTLERPYRSIRQGMQALRAAAGQVDTLVVLPGVYSPLTTGEIFPIDFSDLTDVTLQGADPEDLNVVAATLIDAGFSGDIIFLGGNRGITISGLTLAHGAHGILANAVSDVTLRRNLIVENIFDGVSLGINATDGNRMSENTIYGNGQNGIGLFDQAHATITANTIGTTVNNVFRGNGFSGIFITGNTSAMIANNTIMFNTIGINLFANAEAETTLIDTNTVVNNNLVGVLVQQRSAATITNNMINQNGIQTLLVAPPPVADFADALILGVGIAVDNESSAVISDNDIDINLFGGIVVERNATAEIARNNIRNNGIAPNGFGLVLFDNAAAAVTTITRNTISANQGTGVVVADGSAAEILENTLSQNVGAGLFVLNSADTEIMSNLVQGNLNGILTQFATSTVVTDNSIIGNFFDGIRLESLSEMVRIENNSVSSNGEDGVQIDGGSFATLRAGVISTNIGNGIFISQASRADVGPDGAVVTVSGNAAAGIQVNPDGSVAGIGSVQDDTVCVLFSNIFPFECVQFAFQYVFDNFGGDFIPPLDYFFGPYFSIP